MFTRALPQTIVQRLVCGVVAATLHLFAGFELATSLTDPATLEQPPGAARPSALRVTGFYSERSVNSLQPATLTRLVDVVSAIAIVVHPPSLPDIEPLAADSFAKSRDLTTVEDVHLAGRLQGLYEGQIKSRLARLLEDAKVQRPLEAGSCIVHVVQDEHGKVVDVMSDECEVSDDWREEIGRTIYRSSPLPLPPAGLAMGSYLTLDLSSI